MKAIFVKPNPAERTAKPIRTILSFFTFCAMTFVFYIHSFVATDFWITFLPIVLREERFFYQRPDRKTRDIFAYVSCNVYGAFASSFGSTNNSHSGKCKVVMGYTLLNAYSAISFGELILHFPDFASLKTTFFTVPPTPSMVPFPW